MNVRLIQSVRRQIPCIEHALNLHKQGFGRGSWFKLTVRMQTNSSHGTSSKSAQARIGTGLVIDSKCSIDCKLNFLGCNEFRICTSKAGFVGIGLLVDSTSSTTSSSRAPSLIGSSCTIKGFEQGFLIRRVRLQIYASGSESAKTRICTNLLILPHLDHIKSSNYHTARYKLRARSQHSTSC